MPPAYSILLFMLGFVLVFVVGGGGIKIVMWGGGWGVSEPRKEQCKRKVELGSRSWMDCLAVELFLSSCFFRPCLCRVVELDCHSWMVCLADELLLCS